MERKVKEQPFTTTPKTKTDAKVDNISDMAKVLEYFKYKVGTSLDAAIDLGVLRNSITYYIADLEELGLLQAICRLPDSHTGFKAKHYSADPRKWLRAKNLRQLDLFGEEVQL